MFLILLSNSMQVNFTSFDVWKDGRWVAKLVARLPATAALWVRIQTFSQKYRMGDISKEWPTHLYVIGWQIPILIRI